MVKVLRVGEKDGTAVSVAVSTGVIKTTLIAKNGKPYEPAHSRSREDGKQVRTPGDLYIPPADYRQMFRVAGAILGKPRKKAR